MMVVKATPTKVILKEYCNFTLMLGTAATSLSLAYWGKWGQLPPADLVISVAGLVGAAPAIWLGFHSVLKMSGVASRPVTVRHQVTAGGGPAPIRREVNGVSTFFKTTFMPRLAFDPTYKNDPDVMSRKIRYEPESLPLKWWTVDVMKRSDRPVIISVTLYEDLVCQIIEKAWRAQSRGKPHPISQHYLCSLHYEALSGQRLDEVNFLAFKKLGGTYRLFAGAPRQGTSGKLAGSPIWCRRQLGLST